MSRAPRLVPLVLVIAVPTVAVAALTLAGGVEASGPGLPDAGALTRWSLPVVRGLRDVAAVLTVGLLVLTAVVLPVDGDGPASVLTGARARAVWLAAVSGAAWVMAGFGVLVLTYAEIAATPVQRVGVDALVVFVRDFDLGRALAASTALALLVATGAALARRATTTGLLAVGSLLALVPLALVGHSATAADHDAAVDTLAAHLVAVTVWVGGLAGLVLFRGALGAQPGLAVGRYSRLAGWCFGVVAVSGVVGAAVRVRGWETLVTSGYGALLAGKVAILLTLAVLGFWQRRRVLHALATAPAHGRRLFARLAAAEVALMAAATGLAVALAATSPTSALDPAPKVGRATALLGYPMPPPLTPLRWFTEWRIDVLWTSVALVGLGWYLVSVRRLHRRGDRWPAGRTAAWVVGWSALVWSTSSGPGVYGSVLFSMHMVQHMTIAMAVPIFLVLGAPATLALRVLPARVDGSMGPREWLLAVLQSRLLRVLSNPLVAMGIFLGSLVVFYYSPLFELALRTHTGHVLMTLHFILVGYLFASVICGVDPGPARPPHLFRFLLLIATMGFHAFFGVVMMGSREVLGGAWFAALGRTWGPTLAEEQNLGGALAWALGDYPVAIMVTALAFQWLSHDARERRRYDRQADRDGDAQLAAYNAYLRGLADRAEADRG